VWRGLGEGLRVPACSGSLRLLWPMPSHCASRPASVNTLLPSRGCGTHPGRYPLVEVLSSGGPATPGSAAGVGNEEWMEIRRGDSGDLAPMLAVFSLPNPPAPPHAALFTLCVYCSLVWLACPCRLPELEQGLVSVEVQVGWPSHGLQACTSVKHERVALHVCM
jgi:hypothetical protein